MDDTIRDILRLQQNEGKEESGANLYFYFQQHVKSWGNDLRYVALKFSENQTAEMDEANIGGSPPIESDGETTVTGLSIIENSGLFKAVIEDILRDDWELSANITQIQMCLFAGIRFYNEILGSVSEDEFEQVMPLVLMVDRRMGVVCGMANAIAVTSGWRIGKANQVVGNRIGKDEQKEKKYPHFREAFLKIPKGELIQVPSVAELIFKIRNNLPDGEKVTDNPIRNWLTGEHDVETKKKTDRPKEYILKFHGQIKKLRKNFMKDREK